MTKYLLTTRRRAAEDLGLHHTNLHNHLRNGEPLNCPVDLAVGALVTLCMANESWRTGRMLAWDAEKKAAVPADTVPLNPFPDGKPAPV